MEDTSANATKEGFLFQGGQMCMIQSWVEEHTVVDLQYSTNSATTL